MLCASSLTLSDIGTLTGAVCDTFTPVRRLVEKLGAAASNVYEPSAKSVTEYLPSESAATMRGAPPASFLTLTTALGIPLPVTSPTTPDIVPRCWAEPDR